MRVIPWPLRVLAGLAAAAAALAIFMLVRAAPDNVIGLVDFALAAAKSLLFLSVIALFGYVAVTGLPPVHWWSAAGQRVWTEEPEFPIAPDMHRYLARLRHRHPDLRECWLLDPARGNEWRLLAFGQAPVLDAVRGDWDIRRRDVRLHLVDDEDGCVAPAWGRSTPAAFASWDWEPQGNDTAEFRCPVAADVRIARRLWAAAPAMDAAGEAAPV